MDGTFPQGKLSSETRLMRDYKNFNITLNS
jgi:hypothetical protein